MSAFDPTQVEMSFTLHVAGIGLRGSGYPNARRTIDLLQQTSGLRVFESERWLPESMHLWRLAQGPKRLALRQLLILGLGNVASLLRVMGKIGRNGGPVYLPYPSIFFLWWASWLPRRWRPVCIADAYVSVWDSFVRDRGGAREYALASHLIRRIERRALRAATVVLVDTQANRAMLVDDLEVEPRNVRSLPLAIEEDRFLRLDRYCVSPGRRRLRVLFVGTLIPLHGIPVILEAMRQLLADDRFEFRILGEGQQSDLVERFMADHPSHTVSWVRGWSALDEVAAEVGAADICLGVFGGGQKAARVLPFKLYMYLAAGRPIISQSLLSTPEGVPDPPMEAVAPADAGALVDAILRLAGDAARREHLGAMATAYYRQWLSNQRVVDSWLRLLSREASMSAASLRSTLSMIR